jgi:hypothetical protein
LCVEFVVRAVAVCFVVSGLNEERGRAVAVFKPSGELAAGGWALRGRSLLEGRLFFFAFRSLSAGFSFVNFSLSHWQIYFKYILVCINW